MSRTTAPLEDRELLEAEQRELSGEGARILADTGRLAPFRFK